MKGGMEKFDPARRRFLAGAAALSAAVLRGKLAPSVEAAERPREAPFAFYGDVVRVESGKLVDKWKGALPKLDVDLQKLADAEKNPSPAIAKFERMLSEARQHTGLGRVGWVNQGVNLAIKSVPEPKDKDGHYEDKWLSPLQAIERGGDCEEYAMAKWLGLRRLGVPEQDLYLVIGELADRKRPPATREHMVLAARTEEGWRMLNDLDHLLLDETDTIELMKPKYYLTREGVFKYVHPRGRPS